jgi:hypothetical protein
MYDKVSLRVILAGQMRVLLLYNSWDSSDYGPIKCTTKEIITIKLTNIYLEINLLIITLLYYPPPPGGTAILPEYIHYYG